MPKKKPIETFGVFAIHADGTVTTTSGQRPADILASCLRGIRQGAEDDMATMAAMVNDYQRAEMRARAYAERGREFRPVPLAMSFAVDFEGRGVDA